MPRRDKVLSYGCTNYYFEIEDGAPDMIDEETGELIPGLRNHGKSKVHRPDHMVRMGCQMVTDCFLPQNDALRILGVCFANMTFNLY